MALVVVGTLLEQVLSIQRELLSPRDLNAAWSALPAWVGSLDAGQVPWAGLWQIGGWLQALVAAALHLCGRDAAVFQGVTVVWVASTLLAIGGMTRSATAVALAAQIPALVVLPRGGWIHSPEAALALVGAWMVRVGPRGDLPLTVCVAGLVLLRPSGVVWAALLAVGWVFEDARRRAGRRWPLLAVWILASVPSMLALGRYAGGKLGMAARYAAEVPGLVSQLPLCFGATGGALVLAGVLRLVWTRGRGLGRRDAFAFGAVAAPLAILGVTGAGLDNFPVLSAGIVLLLSASFDRAPAVLPRVVSMIVFAGWAMTTGARVWEGRDETEGSSLRVGVVALFDAACPARGPGNACVVVVDQGLFHPFAEDDTLELYLAGEDHVRLVKLHALARAPIDALPSAALVTWDCGARNALWRQRFPTNDQDRARVVRRAGLHVARRDRVEGCQRVWMTRAAAQE